MFVASVALAMSLVSAEAASPVVPAQLDCVARFYRVQPAFEHGEWFAALPDGTRIPFDDHARKSFDERLSSPDVKDLFLVP